MQTCSSNMIGNLCPMSELKCFIIAVVDHTYQVCFIGHAASLKFFLGKKLFFKNDEVCLYFYMILYNFI